MFAKRIRDTRNWLLGLFAFIEKSLAGCGKTPFPTPNGDMSSHFRGSAFGVL
jgi:hypothetical protein